MNARDRLIAWLGEVHAVPPFDVGGLIRDVEAAAEERGRRSGVEERDELRALLLEVETTLAGQREIEGASPATVSAIVAKLAAYAVHHPALAPRDSGKEKP